MTEQQGEQGWALHKAIENNELERRRLLFENMALIHEMHNSKLYKVVLGDENAPWNAYLTQFGVFYSASKIYMLNKIYGTFIKGLGLTPEQIVDIPHSKLSLIISFVTKENVHEWLMKARELTSQDFQDEIRKVQGKESYLTCPHTFTEYEICGKCSFRHRK